MKLREFIVLVVTFAVISWQLAIDSFFNALRARQDARRVTVFKCMYYHYAGIIEGKRALGQFNNYKSALHIHVRLLPKGERQH